MSSCRRFLSAFGFALAGLAGTLPASAQSPAPKPLAATVRELAFPAPAGSGSAGLVAGADGSVWISWVEPGPSDTHVLRCAPFDRVAGTWGAARTIATGKHWSLSGADRPALAVEANGQLTALWLVGPASAPVAGRSGHAHGETTSVAWSARSTDHGVTWTAPVTLTDASHALEFASLRALAGNGVLAAWLDGRAKHGPMGAQQLFARTVGGAGADVCVDPSVCDCCQTTLASFPDGSALLAYRGRTKDEIRDIRVARFVDGTWSESRTVSPDGWKIAGCPVNGPHLASVGGRASLVWFTAADGKPRVLASSSPDAGQRWLQPIRIDGGDALGRVDSVQLADGTVYVTWLEGGTAAPGLWLRRVTPTFEAAEAIRLAAFPHPTAAGFPRAALVKDYDATPAEMVVVCASGDASAPLRTLAVTLPALSTLAGRAPCLPCDEADAAATRGFPVKGIVVSADPARSALLVKHEEIPGVMRAMTMEFQADPAIVAAATPGRELLARIERRGKQWHIFQVKWIGLKK